MIGAICAFIAEVQLKKMTDMNTFRISISILRDFLDNTVRPPLSIFLASLTPPWLMFCFPRLLSAQLPSFQQEEEIDGQELLNGISGTLRYYFCKVVHHASWQAHVREEIAFETVWIPESEN